MRQDIKANLPDYATLSGATTHLARAKSCTLSLRRPHYQPVAIIQTDVPVYNLRHDLCIY
ncbi:hypothetical protein GCM10027565_28720 [Bordetella tumulicola]